MSLPNSVTSDDKPQSIQLPTLIERVQSFRPSVFKADYDVEVVALFYGVIAWSQGEKFFLTYLGVLVVVFMLHERGVRRVERQIDTVVDTLREMQNDKRDST